MKSHVHTDSLVDFANALRDVLGLDPLPFTSAESERRTTGMEQRAAPWDKRWRDGRILRESGLR